MIEHLFSFAAGAATAYGAQRAYDAWRIRAAQPIPPSWLPEETPMQPSPIERTQRSRSPYAPKPRAQEPYIPKMGKPIPSARSRERLPSIHWGTE